MTTREERARVAPRLTWCWRRQWTLAVACAAAAVVTAAAGACRPATSLDRYAPPGHDRVARQLLAAVRAGDVAGADTMLAPATRQIPNVADSLRAAAAALPAGPIDTLRLVGVHTFNSGEVERSFLTYELHTRAGWGIVSVGVAEELGLRFIEGLRANRLPDSLEATNAFRFAGKGAANYLVMLLAVACAAYSLATAVAAVRTPALPRRWGWAFVALVGTSTVSLDWTTGHVGWQLLSVLVVPAAVTRAGFAAPWIVAAACPVGAFAVRERIRRARRGTPAAAPPSPDPAPDPETVVATTGASPAAIPASSASVSSSASDTAGAPSSAPAVS